MDTFIQLLPIALVVAALLIWSGKRNPKPVNDEELGFGWTFAFTLVLIAPVLGVLFLLRPHTEPPAPEYVYSPAPSCSGAPFWKGDCPGMHPTQREARWMRYCLNHLGMDRAYCED